VQAGIFFIPLLQAVQPALPHITQALSALQAVHPALPHIAQASPALQQAEQSALAQAAQAGWSASAAFVCANTAFPGPDIASVALKTNK